LARMRRASSMSLISMARSIAWKTRLRRRARLDLGLS
jgi:hypothetical protein